MFEISHNAHHPFFLISLIYSLIGCQCLDNIISISKDNEKPKIKLVSAGGKEILFKSADKNKEDIITKNVAATFER